MRSLLCSYHNTVMNQSAPFISANLTQPYFIPRNSSGSRIFFDSRRVESSKMYSLATPVAIARLPLLILKSGVLRLTVKRTMSPLPTGSGIVFPTSIPFRIAAGATVWPLLNTNFSSSIRRTSAISPGLAMPPDFRVEENFRSRFIIFDMYAPNELHV